MMKTCFHYNDVKVRKHTLKTVLSYLVFDVVGFWDCENVLDVLKTNTQGVVLDIEHSLSAHIVYFHKSTHNWV